MLVGMAVEAPDWSCSISGTLAPGLAVHVDSVVAAAGDGAVIDASVDAGRCPIINIMDVPAATVSTNIATVRSADG
jgi:hypothetical protein